MESEVGAETIYSLLDVRTYLFINKPHPFNHAVVTRLAMPMEREKEMIGS